MAIDFPASPTNGQTHVVGSVTYTWDGVKWTAVAAGGGGTSVWTEAGGALSPTTLSNKVGIGTARPQGDRYIKDSTIAKVTSTTVICTHLDGSYCVPCVLMAC